ncbi:MAG: hypothetical protein ACFFCQ_07665 [Promethearchaeota archaeon]
MAIILGHLHCDHCNQRIWPPEMYPMSPYYSCSNCGDVLCNEAVEIVIKDKDRVYKCKSCGELVEICTWPRPGE